ncbi:MAG: tetratricopeptide repeat protein [Pseudomonadota bacterium]
MTDLLFFTLFFLAIAIGWALGRRSLQGSVSDGYFLGRQARDEVDNSNTLGVLADELPPEASQTHRRMVLGAQLRLRGEVDNAVRVHRELLDTETLPERDHHQIQLELAKDFFSAGLLDRAEQLLLQLVKDSEEQAQAAREHLLDIYETERDWSSAINIAKASLSCDAPVSVAYSDSKSALHTSRRLAHYACELGQEMQREGKLQLARDLFQEALVEDSKCVRASLLLAQLELAEGRYGKAIESLRQVRNQDSDYVPETVGPLAQCYRALGDDVSLQRYLMECLAQHPTAGLVCAIAQDIKSKEGAQAASEFLSVQLLERPSLAGLSQLVEWHRTADGEATFEELEVVQTLTNRLAAARPNYRCVQCGFAGKQLHWHCPGCKRWGSIKAIDGVV